ncbi:MAG: D-alanyl-D-alanine carboxypeptidase [Fibrobacteria bacterium]|nr:D-alanyl-D-alanine carboxypeptidase [Fibrobacteria bacterium]
MLHNKIVILFVVCLGLPLFAESLDSRDALYQQMEKLLSEVSPEATVSFVLRDVQTGKILFEKNGNKYVIPASTLKLVTSWVALDKLGPDKRLETRLGYSGKISENILLGNLIITGGADPSFCSNQFGKEYTSDRIFSSWLAHLKKIGIDSVQGCVIGDGTLYKGFSPNPYILWEDVGNYYSAVTSGLCFSDNRYSLFFKGHVKPGIPITLLSTSPEFIGISHFENHLVTGPSSGGDSVYIYGSFLSRQRALYGWYGAGKEKFSVKGALPFPSWTCAMEFRKYLKLHNISFGGNSAGACAQYSTTPGPYPFLPENNSSITPLTSHQSPPLRDLIKHINYTSDNGYTEQLLALLAIQAGQKGGYRDGIIVIEDYLKNISPVLETVRIKDGCGLSRLNWISGEQITLLLAYAAQHPNFPDFRSTLLSPIKEGRGGGRFEPYYHQFKNLKVKLLAKTGSMSGVQALAGFLKTEKGKELSFFYVWNNTQEPSSSFHKSCSNLLRLANDNSIF